MNSIYHSYKIRFFAYSFFLCAFGLPLLFPIHHSYFIFILLFVWLFLIHDLSKFSKNKILIASGIIYGFALISILFSNNTRQAFSSVETMTSFIIFPLIIFSCSAILSGLIIKRTLIAFIAGAIVLNLTSLFFISFDVWDPHKLQSQLINANNIIVNIHPIFTSLYISFSIFFLVDQFFPLQTDDRSKLGWIIFSLVVFFIFLFWLNSRAGILAFLIASFFFIIYKFHNKNRIYSFGCILIFIGLLAINSHMRYRFFNAPVVALTSNLDSPVLDSDLLTLKTRLEIWQCNLELINVRSFAIGYGTGDVRDELCNCYERHGFQAPLLGRMDSHNEYFSQLLSNGVIGITAFILLLLLPFIQAVKSKDPLLCSFILLVSITALFENVLGSQKGVAFIALFLPLLWIRNSHKQTK